MTSIEIARRLAELNQAEKACAAYSLALEQGDLSAAERLEAASFLLFSGGSYKAAFTEFVHLFNTGNFRGEILEIMTQAFYLPNVKKLKKQYEANIEALSQYPYFFRKDFPNFEDLPILFFPFEHQGYVPLYPSEECFGAYVDVNDPVIDRWFFKDLENPILADDVYSQYQLEYLNDNVRKSEWVARENHVYLHYTDFMTFCSWLQVLNFVPLLSEEKLVFLIEEEISRYPIDFYKEYGIDYSQYEVKRVTMREIKRLIFQNQLSSHNGSDFFVEVLHGHPNLITFSAVMFSVVKEMIEKAKTAVWEAQLTLHQQKTVTGSEPIMDLMQLKNPTDKDYWVALLLYETSIVGQADPNSRIVPALFFQPHFGNITYTVKMPDASGKDATLFSKQYEEIVRSPILKNFKYIKTITPMRRPSTSYAASVRFVVDNPTRTEEEIKDGKGELGSYIVPDFVTERLLNRSYMTDPDNRLFRDSRLVRFEDGKLNPLATFTALAEFLDIPYTESMTYCSSYSGLNPETLKGNDRGFDPAAIYRKHEKYANDAERAFIEYFFRDVYEAYGYNFEYYDGEPVDEDWIENQSKQFDCLEELTKKIWTAYFRKTMFEKPKDKDKGDTIKETKATDGDTVCDTTQTSVDTAPHVNSDSTDTASETDKVTANSKPLTDTIADTDASDEAVAASNTDKDESKPLTEEQQKLVDSMVDAILEKMKHTRLEYAKALLRGLRFVNKEGQPLQMATPLKLDPELLEHPLYH